MAKLIRQRESTIKRDKIVHEIYNEIISELGDLSGVVSKGYIYDRIRNRTKLSIRTISFIVNHTPS